MLDRGDTTAFCCLVRASLVLALLTPITVHGILGFTGIRRPVPTYRRFHFLGSSEGFDQALYYTARGHIGYSFWTSPWVPQTP